VVRCQGTVRREAVTAIPVAQVSVTREVTIHIARSSARCRVGASKDELTARMASVPRSTARTQTVQDHVPSDRLRLADSEDRIASTRPSIGLRFAVSPVVMANTGRRIVVARNIAMVIIAPNLVVPGPAKGQTMTDLAPKDPTETARNTKRIDRRIPRAIRPPYVVSRSAPSTAGQL